MTYVHRRTETFVRLVPFSDGGSRLASLHLRCPSPDNASSTPNRHAGQEDHVRFRTFPSFTRLSNVSIGCSAENWQAALRRQYLKRDPNNPSLVRDTNTSTAPSQSITPQPELDGSHEEDEAGAGTLSNDSGPPQSIEEFVASSKDWLLLPTLQKLDSLHTVSEWHFHNPMRLRTLMKSNDDNADWVRSTPTAYCGFA